MTRKALAFLAFLAFLAAPVAAQVPAEAVATGADVLIAADFAQLRGKKVGLITNHTGVTAAGVPLVDVFGKQKAFQLVALFSPEHGIEGRLDQSNISDSTHAGTGLVVHSLYGDTRKPTAAMLKGVDTLVFDIQDIGARFYTYVSTLKLAMEAAAEQKVKFVVLDRPNPIGGVAVAGPVLDEGQESFVGYHTIAVRHGMTVGELAKMMNDERKIGCDLTVIQCTGWRRDLLFDATGLPWVNPSPNMRNLNQALLYPGIGLLETTNISVGRGTDTPFEIVGAPWLEPRALAQALRAQNLPGVAFVPTWFTPDASKHKGQRCGGMQILITDRKALEPLRIAIALATALRTLHGKDWDSKGLDRLLLDAATEKAILAGEPVAKIVALWRDELAAFNTRRARFLIYE